MTPVQQARSRAFAAQLRARGACFETDATPPVKFRGVRSFSPQSLDDFAVAPAERTDGDIFVLRECADPLSPLRPFDYYALQLAERVLLTNTGDTNEKWRIARIEDNPVNVFVILHCNLDQS